MRETIKNIDDCITYTVPIFYLPAIINDDYSGLSDDEEKELDEFLNGIYQDFGRGHWAYNNCENYFTYTNDINNLGNDCVDIQYIQYAQDKSIDHIDA